MNFDSDNPPPIVIHAKRFEGFCHYSSEESLNDRNFIEKNRQANAPLDGKNSCGRASIWSRKR